MDNCHYCNTYYVLVHIPTHTATVLCICNPARIFTCLMTLAVTWPEQILSTHPRPMICNDNYGSQQVCRDVPSIFFTTCRPRLFHWSKPSETSLAHLHWVMWCPSLCVVERGDGQPLHVRSSLTQAKQSWESPTANVFGAFFFFSFFYPSVKGLIDL